MVEITTRAAHLDAKRRPSFRGWQDRSNRASRIVITGYILRSAATYCFASSTQPGNDLGRLIPRCCPRRARRSRHGARSPKARQCRPSFGSRLAIHLGRFRRSPQGSRRSSVDRLGRRRLRQCDVREFLRHPRMRTDRSASLPISQRGADGRLSIHRRVLQSLTPPLGPQLSFVHRIRKET
jgi:hypothetical protein